MRHLKRARKCLSSESSKPELELVICPQSVAENDVSDEIKSLFQEIRVVNVCRHKPQSRIEFKEWGESWPIIFRPTELSEERERGLPPSDLQNIRHHLSSLSKQDPSSHSLRDRDGLIVNPLQNEVSCLVHSSSSSDLVLQVVISADQVRDYLDKMPRHASRSITTNPLYSSSPSLLCIEGVAALVRGEEVFPFASSLPGPPLCPSAG